MMKFMILALALSSVNVFAYKIKHGNRWYVECNDGGQKTFDSYEAAKAGAAAACKDRGGVKRIVDSSKPIYNNSAQ